MKGLNLNQLYTRMANNFSRPKVAQLLIESIDNSRLEYDKLNETMLSDAPEYFITVNSVKSLSKRFSYSDVTMEWSVKDALDEIKNKSNKKGKKPGRPYSGLRENGRFDIVLWEGDSPWGVIEMKKGIWEKKQYEGDIKRIRAILKKAQDIRKNYELNSFFAFYLEREDSKNKSKMADSKISDFLKNMKKNAEIILNEEFDFKIVKGEFSRYKGELRNWGFQPFCFVIHN